MAKKKNEANKTFSKMAKDFVKAESKLTADDAPGNEIPESLLLALNDPAGFFFGTAGDQAVGMQQGREGNILVIGGNGSGKSACIAMPTLETWCDPMLVLDIKGELSARYAELHREGLVSRPYIVLDFEDPQSLSYDPFAWLLSDQNENLIYNIREIVLAIIPVNPEAREPFWDESEQAFVSVALLYYFKAGLSFSECMCRIIASNMENLCAELRESNDLLVQMFLGEMCNMSKSQLNEIARGVRNKILPFATDAFISHLFRGKRENAKCLNWQNLEEYNIFLRIPEHKVEQWGCAVVLMLSQLIRYLECRPEKYSAEGKKSPQILLLLDEFA